jgi:purine-binding chemotaxis protein CheW
MSIDKSSGIKTFLSFKLNEEIFAIDVVRVINILEMSVITSIPKAPEYMKGVINLRGAVLPVIDLRIKFGFPGKEVTPETGIIVLSIDISGETILLGIMVDAVREVIEMKTESISPLPSLGTGYNSGFIEGMWRAGDKFIMVLDIEKVFSTDEIIDFREHVARTDSEINTNN